MYNALFCGIKDRVVRKASQIKKGFLLQKNKIEVQLWKIQNIKFTPPQAWTHSVPTYM